MASERHYIGLPAVDYLTLTTFYEHSFRFLRTLAASIGEGDVSEAKTMQYAGEKATGYFAGQGNQSGREHFMVRSSGAYAHDLALLTHEATAQIRAAKCSRVDVQVTVPQLGALRLGELGRTLQDGEYGPFRRRGQAMKVNVIHGGDGLDTIYIGVRSSPRFIRVYTKPIGEERFTRFEVEFKEDLAAQAWSGIRTTGIASLGPLLRSELDCLPLGFVNALTGVYGACGASEGQRLQAVYAEPSWEKQLRWVRKQVAPTLEKLLASPGRDDVRKLLADLLENY